MKHFSVTTEHIDLPRDATPQARRIAVAWRGQPVCAFTQGQHRCYLYPVYTPAGVPVTAESPVDHPHHDSVTVGADVLVARFPPLTPAISPLEEHGTYNMYTNSAFQGRAPGRLWPVDINAIEIAPDHLQVVQSVEWQGPVEWGAAGGHRVLAREKRTTSIRPGNIVNTFDIRSELMPTEWDLTIGPTRHAYFTIRAAYGLRVVDGGTLIDADGRCGGTAITNSQSTWVDLCGAGSHGKTAGLAILPHASTAHVPWIAYDWGTVNVNPFTREPATIPLGHTLDLGIRLIAHDGDADNATIAARSARFMAGTNSNASMPRSPKES